MYQTSIILAGTESGLYRASFIDDSWHIDGLLYKKNVCAIFSIADEPQTITVCSDEGIFQVQGNSKIWTQLFSEAVISAVQSADRKQFWIGTATGKLWHSSDSGLTWTDISAPLFALAEHEDWYEPLGADTPLISALGYDGKCLCAGIRVGGVAISLDEGKIWHAATGLNGEAMLAVSAPVTDNGTWLARTEDGIFFSVDGMHWRPMDEGMAHIFCTSLIQLKNGALFAAAGDVPPGNWIENATTALYHAKASGKAWQMISQPANGYISALNSLGAFDLLAGTQDGALFVRRKGQEWEKIGQVTGSVLSLIGLPGG